MDRRSALLPACRMQARTAMHSLLQALADKLVVDAAEAKCSFDAALMGAACLGAIANKVRATLPCVRCGGPRFVLGRAWHVLVLSVQGINLLRRRPVGPHQQVPLHQQQKVEYLVHTYVLLAAAATKGSTEHHTPLASAHHHITHHPSWICNVPSCSCDCSCTSSCLSI